MNHLLLLSQDLWRTSGLCLTKESNERNEAKQNILKENTNKESKSKEFNAFVRKISTLIYINTASSTIKLAKS